MRTIVIALFCLALALPVQASDMAPGKGVKVKSARATWTTGFFLEALVSRGLEDLGFKVDKPKDLANPIFYQSVMRGDIDFWANGWFPLHNAQLPKGFKDGAQIAGVISAGGALQGFLASKKDVEKFGIKSLADFKRPEVKKAFDDNGDGKADLVACPPGWGCEKAITRDLEVYDLKDDINPIKAGYSASMADAVARFNAGQTYPVLHLDSQLDRFQAQTRYRRHVDQRTRTQRRGCQRKSRSGRDRYRRQGCGERSPAHGISA